MKRSKITYLLHYHSTWGGRFWGKILLCPNIG